jgi:acyl carrier protein
MTTPLNQVIAKVLRERPENITDATSRKSHRRWDSFNHVQLVVHLEETYGVKLTNAEIEALDSVAGVRTLLQTKGVAV